MIILTDNTTDIVRNFEFVKLIQLQSDSINSYKKKAIETGIAAASGDLIVTTDADCIVPENWLKTIAAFKKETDAVFIAAPVAMENEAGLCCRYFNHWIFLCCRGSRLHQ